MFSNYRLTQLSVYFSVALFSFVSLLLVFNYGIRDGGNLLSYFLNLTWYPLRAFFSWLLLPYILLVVFRFIYLFFKSAKDGINPMAYVSRSFGLRVVSRARRELVDVVIYAVPAGLALLLLAFILGRLNMVNVSYLEDARVLGWDYFLTGVYPFIALAEFHYPSVFLDAVRFSFVWLPAIFAVFALYLLHYRRDFFYQFAATFCISLVMLLPLWWYFPVLSPHDRYIDNVYSLAIAPQSVKQGLLNYNPQKEIADFLEGMRNMKNKNLRGFYPTSTMPSAHVVWGTMLFYYAWASDRRLFIFLAPLAVLSSIGTFLLAQHYFVDFPGGILVGAAAILLSYYFARRDSIRFSTKKV